VYQGKKLSEWLQVWSVSGSRVEADEAEAAVHAMGTNALPFLLKWVTYQNPRWKDQLWGSGFVPGFVRKSQLMQELGGTAAEARASHAMLGFRALGPLQASPAVPELLRVARSGQKVASWRAVQVLEIIAPEMLRSSEVLR
jgi:hypothetical protein